MHGKWGLAFSKRTKMHMLSEDPSVNLFKSIFIVSPTNRGNSDGSFTLSNVDGEMKDKFTNLLSKVCN